MSSDADAADSGTVGPVDNDAGTGTGTGKGPLIEILAPEAAVDPNTDTIVTSSTVTARCRVMRSQSLFAHDVNPSSVKIAAKSGKQELAGVVTAEGDDIFEAEFNLADFTNGPLSFTCSADDVAMPANAGTGTVDTFLDLGPEIHILEPADMGTYALASKLAIRFQVKTSRVAATDKEAAPKNIKLEVSGQSMKITESGSDPGLYTASVNYNDRKLFPMAPTSSAISVTAASSRTPKAAVRKERVDITLDADGPSIAVTSPANLSIVRGDVVLAINVSDPAGVDVNSIVGTINKDEKYPLNDWKGGSGSYSTHFDTVGFGFELTQLTINIKASDNVGNVRMVDHVLRLDNRPPIVSLDPPNMRIGSTEGSYCSLPFDPVGSDATNDLDTVQASSMYRVRIEEQTNKSPGANYYYVAGVKDSTVKLFAQGDPTLPFLIDTNDDGQCDEIDLDLPETDKPIQLSLTPLAIKGAAQFSKMIDPTAPAGCVPYTQDTVPPLLCPYPVTEMTVAIPQGIDGKPPAIYAFAPTNGPTGPCEGATWELLPSVHEGWACLAARAEDNIGNVGVSRPIRVCFDDLDGPSACDPTPPDCTENCALPPDFPEGEIFIYPP